MGLLSHIINADKQSTQKSEGLLAKASALTSSIQVQVRDVSLSDFAEKHNINHCALYSRIDDDESDKIIITDCIGLDADTVIKSVSSVDFWRGTLEQPLQLKTYSGSECNQFFQFFSEDTAHQISKLFFIRANDDTVFMACEFDGEQIDLPSSNDVNKIMLYRQADFIVAEDFVDGFKKGSSANLFLISVKFATDNVISSTEASLTDNEKNIISRAIYSMIVSEISRSLSSIDKICYDGNGEIKVVMFASDKIDDQLLQFHLASSLEKLIGSEAQSVEVMLFDSVTTSQDIELFLQES